MEILYENNRFNQIIKLCWGAAKTAPAFRKGKRQLFTFK